jgi:thymidylate kinase
MQVIIITGPQGSGKTTKLKAIQSQLKQQDIEVAVTIGEHMTTPYFTNLLRDMAMAGAKHFLADDCTQFQIKAVQEIAAQGIHSGVPSDFEVHLVRHA